MLLFTGNQVLAAAPFTDVKPEDAFYTAVSELYDARIISDDGSGLFRPNEPMNRDFYVSLATMIGCKECLTPSYEDIARYHTSPFEDLSKENPYYYCIAYAQDEDITQGYIVDTTGKAVCENGNSYVTPPFCAENKTTRIEAAAMLLRRAHLWNDTLNSQHYERNEIISDVTEYWYGYAQKALQI